MTRTIRLGRCPRRTRVSHRSLQSCFPQAVSENPGGGLRSMVRVNNGFRDWFSLPARHFGGIDDEFCA